MFTLVAALVSLDITVFGQFMVSRPLVCGPLFGYLAGDIKTGLWIGMIVELIWIGSIPMGAAIPIDVTTITILSTIWSIALPGDQRHGIAILALALALPAGALFRQLDIALRYFNIRIVHWIEDGLEQGKDGRINRAIHIGLLLVFIKSFIFYITLSYAGIWLLSHLLPHLSETLLSGFELAWILLPLVGFGMVVVNFRSDKFPYFR